MSWQLERKRLFLLLVQTAWEVSRRGCFSLFASAFNYQALVLCEPRRSPWALAPARGFWAVAARDHRVSTRRRQTGGELCPGAVLPISQREASSHKIRHFGTNGTPQGEFLPIRALHLVVGCLSWDLLPEPTTAQLPQGGVSVPR